MTRQYQSPQILQVQPIINNREDPMSAPQLWPNRKLIDTQGKLKFILIYTQQQKLFSFL